MRVKPKHLDLSAQPIPPCLRRVVRRRQEIELDFSDPIYQITSDRGEVLRVTREEYYAIRENDIFPSWNWAELPLNEVCNVPELGAL